LVEYSNENRTKRVRAGVTKTADETMSGFRPRTTKYGIPPIPHISLISRKPVDLGTEFKNIGDAETGIMLHLEVQRGKEPMKQLQYSLAYGATAGCTMRMAQAVKKCGQEDQNRDGIETPFIERSE
jgi:hypothetical protein